MVETLVIFILIVTSASVEKDRTIAKKFQYGVYTRE